MKIDLYSRIINLRKDLIKQGIEPDSVNEMKKTEDNMKIFLVK